LIGPGVAVDPPPPPPGVGVGVAAECGVGDGEAVGVPELEPPHALSIAAHETAMNTTILCGTSFLPRRLTTAGAGLWSPPVRPITSVILARSVEIILTAPRSEPALAMSRSIARTRSSNDPARVLVNLVLQSPNTLLHDGHAWKRYRPARLLSDTRAALRDARGADFIVHASYLFLGTASVEQGLAPPLGDIAAAALEAEDLVLSGSIPSCVVRLGYRYGPESRDLRSYQLAFRIGRPYWAGSRGVKQRHLHSDDAASALLAAARQRPVGKTLYAADDTPASFATFMDCFARRVGNRVPLHIPGLMRPLTRVLIAEEHVQQVDLASADAPDRPRPRGFTPLHADYRSGLGQVVDAWKGG
jgi:hypothetical protein